MKPIDIKIIELKKRSENKFDSSFLTLELSGKTINYAIVNTLRRLSLSSVPTYNFCKQSIDIEENTSIYNNDMMKLRLSQLTFPKIKNSIIYLPDEYWNNINYTDKNRIKIEGDDIILEMVINIKNSSSENLNVTTNHAKFYKNNVAIKNVIDSNYPHLLIKLRPDEIFKCHATAVLGVGLRNDIWGAAANAYYDEINKHQYKLSIESQGQMDEYEILIKSCKIIKKKLDDKKYIINKNYKKLNETAYEIHLENEDHTIGLALNYFLQRHKNIISSGLSKPTLLENKIIISFESMDKNVIIYFFQVIDYVIQIFDDIENKLMKLGRKYLL